MADRVGWSYRGAAGPRSETGEVIVERNDEITEELAAASLQNGYQGCLYAYAVAVPCRAWRLPILLRA